MRVRSSKMRVFSFDRYIFRTKFPTGFTNRNVHGFAQFPCDSTALVQDTSTIECVKAYSALSHLSVTMCCFIQFYL